MPTYAYHCKECGHQFEEIQKITASALVDCPKCKLSSLKRGPGGGMGLSFLTSGFYITDYAKKTVPTSKEGASQ